MGIEPTNNGFADRCLTTWLPDHFYKFTITPIPIPAATRIAAAFRNFFFQSDFSSSENLSVAMVAESIRPTNFIKRNSRLPAEPRTSDIFDTVLFFNLYLTTYDL